MPKCILLVEDEEDNRALLTDVLEMMLGQKVLIAKDGTEAIRIAHDQQPDLILMDLNLPKLNGFEATLSLKSSERTCNIPVLAITANAMVGDRKRALQAGCDDYFPKPIHVDAFLKFLQPYLTD